MHTPYEQLLHHPPDFLVRYRFYSKEEGGRQTVIPYQGYRSDFWYEHEDNRPNSLFMIHPEFLEEEGNIILYDGKSVPAVGTALMWVKMAPTRSYHIPRLKIGTKCYFMEGSKRVAEGTVIEILSLATNPII
jgi:hypothetical protein